MKISTKFNLCKYCANLDSYIDTHGYVGGLCKVKNIDIKERIKSCEDFKYEYFFDRK